MKKIFALALLVAVGAALAAPQIHVKPADKPVPTPMPRGGGFQ